MKDSERRFGPGGDADGATKLDEATRRKVYKGVLADKRVANDELEHAKTERKPRLVKEDARGEVWRWEYENQWGEEWVRVSCFRLFFGSDADQRSLFVAVRVIPSAIASWNQRWN
jgi:hypothetical protein